MGLPHNVSCVVWCTSLSVTPPPSPLSEPQQMHGVYPVSNAAQTSECIHT